MTVTGGNGYVHASLLLLHFMSTLQELEQKLVERLKARHETERELKESLCKFGARKLPPIKHKKLLHDEIPVVFGAN